MVLPKRNNQNEKELFNEFKKSLNGANELFIVSPYISSTIVRRLWQQLIKLTKITILFSVGQGDNQEPNVIGRFIQSLTDLQTDPNSKLLEVKKFVHVGIERKLHSKMYYFEKNDFDVFAHGSSNFTENGLVNNVEDLSFDNVAKNDLSYLAHIKELLEDSEVIEYEDWVPDNIEKTIFVKEPVQVHKVVRNKAQLEILQKMREAWDEKINSGIVVAATGLGKTFISFFDFVDEMIYGENKFNSMLYHTPGRITINDAFRNTHDYLSENGITPYSYDQFIDIVNKKIKPTGKFVVFVTSKLLSLNVKKFDNKYFDYIVFDEVHHVNQSKDGIQQTILNYFVPKRKVGFTATINRKDKFFVKNLFEDKLIVNYGILKSIKEKIISPFDFTFRRGINLVDVLEEDLLTNNETKLEKILDGTTSIERAKIIYKTIVDSILPKRRELEGKLKAIVFVETILIAQQISYALNVIVKTQNNKSLIHNMKQPFSISFTSKDDVDELDLSNGNFKVFNDLVDESNNLQVIIAVDRLNEGVDIPDINHVMLFRRTESQRIFLQQIGRGLRNSKANPEKILHVYDFLNVYKHANATFSKTSNFRRVVNEAYEVSPSNANWNAFFEKIKEGHLNLNGFNIYLEDETNVEIEKQVIGSKILRTSVDDVVSKELAEIFEITDDLKGYDLFTFLDSFVEFDFWRFNLTKMNLFDKLTFLDSNDELQNNITFSLVNFFMFGPEKIALDFVDMMIDANKNQSIFEVNNTESIYLRYEFERYINPSTESITRSPKKFRRNKFEDRIFNFEESKNIHLAISKSFQLFAKNWSDIKQIIESRSIHNKRFDRLRYHNTAAMVNLPFDTKFDSVQGEILYNSDRTLIYFSTLFNQNELDKITENKKKHINIIKDNKLIVFKKIGTKANFENVKEIYVFMKSWLSSIDEKHIIEDHRQEFEKRKQIYSIDKRYMFLGKFEKFEQFEDRFEFDIDTLTNDEINILMNFI